MFALASGFEVGIPHHDRLVVDFLRERTDPHVDRADFTSCVKAFLVRDREVALAGDEKSDGGEMTLKVEHGSFSWVKKSLADSTVQSREMTHHFKIGDVVELCSTSKHRVFMILGEPRKVGIMHHLDAQDPFNSYVSIAHWIVPAFCLNGSIACEFAYRDSDKIKVLASLDV